MDKGTYWSSEMTSTEIDQYIYLLKGTVGVVHLRYGPHDRWHISISFAHGTTLIEIIREETFLPDLLRAVERDLRGHGFVINPDFLKEDWDQRHTTHAAEVDLQRAKAELRRPKTPPFLNLKG